MLARAKSFQVGKSSSGDGNSRARGGEHNWRSEQSGSPPTCTDSKTNTWRRELTAGSPKNKATEERRREVERSSSPSSRTNTWRKGEANSKPEERRREEELARMKDEIVREVREEVIFTFTF